MNENHPTPWEAKPTKETWNGGQTYVDSPTSVYVVDANGQVIIGIIDKPTGEYIVDAVNEKAAAEKAEV